MTSRAGRALAAAGLIVFTLASAGNPVAADSSVAGACTNGTGVTVIVDFQSHLGGAIRAGCAEQPVSTGLDALTRAGFQVAQAGHVSGVFICRIDGQPADDPCLGASPASAYWSYWYATPGGSWTYSSVGAGGRMPSPGSVEGWSFAYSPSGDPAPPPRVAPPDPSRPSPTSQPPSAPSSTPSVPTTPTPGATGGRSVGSPPDATVDGGRSAPSGPTVDSPTTTGRATGSALPPGQSATTASPGATTTSTSTEPKVQVESAQKSRLAHSGGSSSSGGAAVGSIIALLAIVAAGTGAGIVSRRRARAE